jgi:hypothetical protein
MDVDALEDKLRMPGRPERIVAIVVLVLAALTVAGFWAFPDLRNIVFR